MSTSQEYLEYVLDLLSESPNISYRSMMGEYVLYANGKVFGGLYDDRFLIKITPSSRSYMPDALGEIPYPGARPMLGVTIEQKERLAELVSAVESELPSPKRKQSKNSH